MLEKKNAIWPFWDAPQTKHHIGWAPFEVATVYTNYMYMYIYIYTLHIIKVFNIIYTYIFFHICLNVKVEYVRTSPRYELV